MHDWVFWALIFAIVVFVITILWMRNNSDNATTDYIKPILLFIVVVCGLLAMRLNGLI